MEIGIRMSDALVDSDTSIMQIRMPILLITMKRALLLFDDSLSSNWFTNYFLLCGSGGTKWYNVVFTLRFEPGRRCSPVHIFYQLDGK